MTGQEWVQSLKNLTPRDRRLLERCAWTLDHNVIREENTPWSPLRGIAPSFDLYIGVWNWDSAFHAFLLRRYDTELAREQLEIMLSIQLEDGRFSDCIRSNGRIVKEISKPPIWPVACRMIHQADPNLPWLARVYQKLQLWENFWNEKRKGQDEELYHYDSDEDGPSYDAEGVDKETMRVEHAKYESGMDTSARWAKNDVNEIWAIDLNCYMVHYFQSMAYMAECLDRPEEAEEYRVKEKRLADAINCHLWDEENGRYIDAYRKDGTFSTVFTPVSFLPLYVGIAPEDRAAKMASHAADETLFYPGMPCCAYNDPSFVSSVYWEGPTWINLDYMMLLGLQRYGYGALAEEMRQLLLHWCDREKRGLFEYYDSVTGEGLGAKHFGWTAACIAELILAGPMTAKYNAF